jgi:hypothetical protein
MMEKIEFNFKMGCHELVSDKSATSSQLSRDVCSESLLWNLYVCVCS